LSVSDTYFALEYFAERGLPAPDWLIQKYQADPLDSTKEYALVAQALTSGDDAELAAAIEAAEARHLVPLAARARITLEQLGDRQFLRRLEEVEAALKGSAEDG
jgi:hypothetical protein